MVVGGHVGDNKSKNNAVSWFNLQDFKHNSNSQVEPSVAISIYIKRYVCPSVCYVLFVPRGQTFSTHSGGGQTFSTHSWGDKHFPHTQGGQTFFYTWGGQTFLLELVVAVIMLMMWAKRTLLWAKRASSPQELEFKGPVGPWNSSNLKETEIRQLERIEEMFLRKIFKA